MSPLHPIQQTNRARARQHQQKKVTNKLIPLPEHKKGKIHNREQDDKKSKVSKTFHRNRTQMKKDLRRGRAIKTTKRENKALSNQVKMLIQMMGSILNKQPNIYQIKQTN